ncbi:hypothetical protein V9L05_15970 [Bernardetia sp. Wsw4-3y2]|uniref:hypothetical protein n=1 Tax=Bernardetia sp. Wsw4-3y2 TaxID=3127471 RepID=UPI0030CE6746
MNFIKNIAFTILGLLVFVSCSEEHVILEQQTTPETTSYVSEEYYANRIIDRKTWEIKFNGARDFFYPTLDDEKFRFSHTTHFEKRWVNRLSQWVPIKMRCSGNYRNLSVFEVYPTSTAVKFFIDSTKENKGYLSYEIELQFLFIKNENANPSGFDIEGIIRDYYYDEKITDGFYLPHFQLNNYDYSSVDSTSYVSVKKRFKCRNTKEGLEFGETSDIKESLEEIRELGHFYKIKVVENLPKEESLPAGNSIQAGYQKPIKFTPKEKRQNTKIAEYEEYDMTYYYTLRELDSVLQLEKNKSIE